MNQPTPEPSSHTKSRQKNIQSKFQRLIENLGPGYIFYTRLDNDELTYISPSVKDVFGYLPEEVLGDYKKFLTENPINLQIHDSRDTLRKGQRPAPHIFEYFHKNGDRLQLEITEYPVLDEKGKVLSVEGIARDVTQVLLKERALLDSENNLNQAQRIAHIGNRVWDIRENRTHWSDELYRILGRNPEDFPVDKDTFIQCVHPDDRDRITSLTEKVIAELAPYSVHFRVIRPDGSLRFVHEKGEIHTDASGEALSLVGAVRDMTEQEKTNFFLEASPSVLFYWKAENKWPVEFVTSNISQFGYNKEDFINSKITFSEIIHPHDKASVTEEVLRYTEQQQDNFTQEYRIITRQGEERWINDRTVIERDIHGKPTHFIGIITDITPRKQAEWDLQEQRNFVQKVIDTVSDSVMVINHDNTILMGSQAKRHSRFTDNISVVRTPKCYELLHQLNVPCHELGYPCPLRKALEQKDGKIITEIHHFNSFDGTKKYIELTATPLLNSEGVAYAIIETAHDISSLLITQNELREQAQTFHHQAQHDELTQLPNRLLFEDRLNQAIKQSHRNSHKIAVLFIDLDQFKKINDSLGHKVGDEVLKVVASRLSSCIRETDTVARMGGDEFTVIIDGFKDSNIIADIVEIIIKKMQTPVIIGNHSLFVTTSIGISLYPEDGESADTLLRNADAAMYKSKEEGRNTYHYYAENMTQKAFEHIMMESNLRHALKEHDLFVEYQPQVNTKTGKIIGMEALVRWHHAYLGIISPERFLPLAEETRMIIPLGEQVFKLATAQMAKWRRKGLINCRVAINFSIKQLYQDDLLENFTAILEQNQCKPEWVELEVTEGFCMKNPEKAIQTLLALKNMGIKIAIDDFGTGYSSLTYLKKLPFNKLKIDKSFVHDLVQDADSKAIVISIIALANNMELDVIAEGVETQEQSDFLQQQGCILSQGYLYSRPVADKAMTKLLFNQ